MAISVLLSELAQNSVIGVEMRLDGFADGVANLTLLQPDSWEEVGTIELNMINGEVVGSISDPEAVRATAVAQAFVPGDLIRSYAGSVHMVRSYAPDRRYVYFGPNDTDSMSTAESRKVGYVDISTVVLDD